MLAPLLSALIPMAQTLAPAPFSSEVEIREFLAFNKTAILDQDGDSSDFLELCNNSLGVIDLGGWYLTDDAKQLTKWSFPPTPLEPGERLVVFASKKDRSVAGAELHTNFQLSGDGEFLALVKPDGTSLAQAFAPKFPPQFYGASYGLGLDAAGNPSLGYFTSPTPGAKNGTALPLIAPVGFDVPRGFLEAPTSLGLSCSTPGVNILYTLDGSAPSMTNGTLYAGPISLSSTTIVRAQAFLSDGGASMGASLTQTYLFADQVLAQGDAQAIAAGFPSAWIELDGSDWSSTDRPGASYGLDPGVLALYSQQELIDSLKAIPSISLVMPMQDWFGFDASQEEFGIYVNPKASGKSWTRAASAEYIDPESGQGFAINCGVKTQGGSGGSPEVRSQLSLELRFDGRFGPANLKYKLFEGSPTKNFDRLILDAGNQNSIHSPDASSMPVTYPKRYAQGLRDAFMMDLQRSLGASTSYSRPVHVYLNGLYWGLYNLHERPDQHWSSEHFGGAVDSYDEVRDGVVRDGNAKPVSDPLDPGAWAQALELRQAGLGDANNFDAFAELVDLRDYARYLLLNIWAGNREFASKDWYASARGRIGPGLGQPNASPSFKFHSWDGESVLFWGPAVTAVGDGKFDRSAVAGNLSTNSAYFLSALQLNAEFPLLLADEAHAQLFNGGALWVDPAFDDAGTPYDSAFPERNPAASIYSELAADIESAVILEYARWGNYFHSSGEYTPLDWALERERLLNDYFPVRSGVVLAQLRNAGVYPLLDAPVFQRHGGLVPAGFQLSMTVPAGAAVYFTLDGSDPRAEGGAIAGTLYSGPVKLPRTQTLVKARAFDGSEWSALNQASFARKYALSFGKLMANNASTLADEAGQFDDWFELHNSSSQALELSGFYLSDDPEQPRMWPIPAGTRLAAGESLRFWADKDPRQGRLHTNFKLRAAGDQIHLYGRDQDANPLIASVVFGPQQPDRSQGLGHPTDTHAERLRR